MWKNDVKHAAKTTWRLSGRRSQITLNSSGLSCHLFNLKQQLKEIPISERRFLENQISCLLKQIVITQHHDRRLSKKETASNAQVISSSCSKARFPKITCCSSLLRENHDVLPGRISSESCAVSWLAAGLLLIVLVVSIPLFVCMPLTSDTVLYDIQARLVFDGGVLYRDLLEPNLPGVVWIHLLLRSLIGWSSEAIRAADLLFVASACWLLARLAISDRSDRVEHQANREHSGSRTTVWLPLLFMGLFYLSRNEWCHCQRDSWMLLPAALAMTVRGRYLAGKSENCTEPWLLLEGVLWGVAFWIKPHIAITVLALFTFEILLTSNRMQTIGRIGIVIAGGLLAGIPGVCWLLYSDAMSSFIEMQLEWNREYLQAGWDRRTSSRLWYMLIRFHPWWMVHIIALPLAIARIYRHVVSRQQFSSRGFENQRSGAGLLSVVYLSWFAQAALLQHAMDYIHVPPVLLGIAVLSTGLPTVSHFIKRQTLAAAASMALLLSPQFWPERLSMWARCFEEGSSSSVKSKLALGRFPDWKNLNLVVDYLADKNVTTGDVTCYTVHTIHVYDALQIRPSTRYAGISVLLELFPSHRERISSDVGQCGHRYVVTDSDESPPDPTRFPWNLPVAFRAGNFSVHHVVETEELLTVTGLESECKR